ncbi:MAG: hypothetical protein FJY54_04065 [Betaproteobacteria bacterium]|nr:hypothetical protein [Betaproteobacteria bacterium]
MMLRWVSGAVLIGIAAGAGAQAMTVPPELWDRPRSGRAVLEQPVIRKAVHAYLAQPSARIVIHHAATQDGLLQAEELLAWLIALAVEKERIALRGGLKSADPINIEVVSVP